MSGRSARASSRATFRRRQRNKPAIRRFHADLEIPRTSTAIHGELSLPGEDA